MALRYTESVLPVLPSTTLAASAGDIVVKAHNLSITTCPTMDYRKIESVDTKLNLAFQGSLVEKLQVYVVTPTAANSADFGIVITQFVPALGRIVVEPLQHTTPTSGATATTICNAWRAQLALLPDLQITGSGTSTLILTAITRSPLFNVVAVNSGITVAETLTNTNIVSSTNASPIVLTVGAVPAEVVVGSTVTVANHLVNTAANGTWRVSAVSATTIELEGTTGNGVGGATGTVTAIASYSQGFYQDLVDLGVDASLLTAGARYSSIGFNYSANSPALLCGNVEQETNKHTLYINEAATNFAAFKTRANEVLSGFVAGGTDSDPELISMQ